MIALGFHPVEHGDIIEYLSLFRHNEVDLVSCGTVGAHPGPFSMRWLFEEKVHHKEFLLQKVGQSLAPVVSLPASKLPHSQLFIAPPAHFRRVFHQVQSWRSNVLPPEEWGWKKTVNCLLPILNTEPPAPASILKLITCACKEGCGRRCGCVKADLRCTTMCKNCRGQSCVNVVEIDIEEE